MFMTKSVNNRTHVVKLIIILLDLLYFGCYDVNWLHL